jgi:hypothetical protein
MVIHANRAMADYLKTRKDVLAGCPLDALFSPEQPEKFERAWNHCKP